MSKHLLIDIGNTNVKFAIYNSKDKSIKNLLSIRTETNPGIIVKELMDVIDNDIESGVFSKVLHTNAMPILKAIVNAGIKLTDCTKLLENNPGETGTDIILGMIGVVDKFKTKSFVIVDLGSATTLTVVDDEKIVGVNIYPGLKSGLDGMLARTGLTFEKDFEVTNAKLGTTTESAIQIGAVDGYYRWIDAEIQRTIKLFKINTVYLNGGDAPILKSNITKNNYIDVNNIIFAGLATLIK